MDLLKVRKFVRPWKQKAGEDPESDKERLAAEGAKTENSEKVVGNDSVGEGVEEEDDDDFITNEVKRRLKELRKNSFMVLIPEEGYPEEDDGDEEEEESSSSEWRKSEVGDGYPWCGLDSLYDKYCERMLFFHKMIGQNLKDVGSWNSSKHSPRSATKKLTSSLRCIYLKRRDELQEDGEQLQQQQENDPLQNLEIAYVAQVALSWEALHCQYLQLRQMISFQPENPTYYNHAAQAFQHFQVVLQRFIENEPFEQGSRVEVYAHARNSMPKLLQVPTFQGPDKENVEDDLDHQIFASDLIKIVEESILTFRLFLKMDKKKMNSSNGHSIARSSLHQVQSFLDKKEIKVKELCKKKKSWKKKTWPATVEEVELLFACIDIKVISRVLKLTTLSKEQLLWCEEKMSKLDLSDNKLRRDGSPILFPC